jgi:hypothetical protein
MRKNDEGAVKSGLRSILVPNPVFGLFIAALAVLLIAVFVYGTRGKYSDPDIADLLRTIAIGALAAGITGIIDRSFLVKIINSEIRARLRENNKLASEITQFGIAAAHKNFDFRTIFNEAKMGETVSWLDTYCPVQNEFLDAIGSAIKRQVKVRMLIIHPKCKNAAYRSIELTGTPDSGEAFNHSLRSFIEKMKSFADQTPGGFQVRFYSDLPCIPMYLIGPENGRLRRAYFSLFLSRASAHLTHLELSDGEWLKNMGTYFEAKWNRWEAATLQAIAPTFDD